MGSAKRQQGDSASRETLEMTHRRRGHALVRVVVPAGGDIFLSVSESERKSTSNRVCVEGRTGASLLFDLDATGVRSANFNRGGCRSRL